MFTLVLTTGQIAGAVAAIGVLLLGVWKYVIQPARKVVKVYNSIGQNGHETVFELLHGIHTKIGTLTEWRNDVDTWRTTVDDTLAFQNRTFKKQGLELQAIGSSVEVLIERHDTKS